MKALWRRWRSDALVRSVVVLLGGSGLAQLIMLAALPVATRLYSPQDFSLLAVFAALISVLSVSACLRLELAIPLPHRQVDARNLLALALGLACTTSAILALAVVLIPDAIAQLLSQPQLRPYLWLVPLGVLAISSYSALQFWTLRNKQYARVARTRIGQAMAAAATQVLCGIASVGPLGLLLAQVLNSGAGSVGLAPRPGAEAMRASRSVRIARMRAVWRRYVRFPRYSALEALFNVAGMHLPLILIAAMSAGAEAGQLVLAMTAMAAPLALFGNSVAQVYLSHAAQQRRDGTLGPYTLKMLSGLVATGVGPLLFAGAVGPDACALLFGEEWRRAGELLRWMTPWFVLQFLAVPVSMALHVMDRQRAALVLQAGGLVLRVGCVLAAEVVAPWRLAEAYAVSGAIFYAVYLHVVLRAVGENPVQVFTEFRRRWALIAMWLLIGLAVAYALRPVVAWWLR